MNFGNPKIFQVWGSPFGVVDICWVVTPKRHPFGVYAFHRYNWFARCKTFSRLRGAQNTEKTAVFGDGSALPECFKRAEFATHTFMGLTLRS